MRYLVIVLLLLPAAALADARSEYRYRTAVMKVIGGQMDAIRAITRGQVRRENLQLHADDLASLARIVPDIFPKGSDVGGSEALPAIWEKPDEFKTATDDLIEAAQAFKTAVASDEDVDGALRRLGQACKNCHDNFRE